jgi:adenine/guanine phosphoribosyltransferase-like PRPP-binding protein
MLDKVESDKDFYLNMLRSCGGYYSCPKSPDGRRLGPLVGYAGKYESPDGKKLQYVGDVYANFSQLESNSEMLEIVARHLVAKLEFQIGLPPLTDFCAAPIGGYSLGTALGLASKLDVIKAEKKVTALATETSREKSELTFARHCICSDARYIIVEDICNNFSTTEDLIKLIYQGLGKVEAIACFLNRSLVVGDEYFSETLGRSIPVISLVRLPILEYKQDSPAVADDVAKGNVAWKPKDNWPQLMRAMGCLM